MLRKEDISRFFGNLIPGIGTKAPEPARMDREMLEGPEGSKIKAELEYESAQELLGIRVSEYNPSWQKSDRPGIAMVTSAKSSRFPTLSPADRIRRSVVVHQSPFNIGLMLLKHLNKERSCSLIIRSVRKNFDPFLNKVEKAKAGRNKAYAKFLDGPVKDYVMPVKSPVFGRDAVVWAASEDVIPRESQTEETARLNGVVVPYTKIGSVLHSVLHRTNLPFEWNRLNQLTYAAPNNVIWGIKPQSYYAIGHKAYAFWVGVPDYNNLKALLDLDLDIYLHLKYVDPIVYAICVVRGESEFAEWKTPEFIGLYHQLLKTGGTWKRVSNESIREAFRFFIPGSSPPRTNLLNKHWQRHSLPHLEHQIPNVSDVLHQLTTRIRHADDVGGDICLGRFGESPFFLSSDKRNNWLFTNQTDTGKTTYSNWIALQQSKNVVSIQLTHQTGMEAAHRWAELFGGGSELWTDLSDSSEPQNDLDKLRENQLDLLRKDAEEVKKELDERFEKWKKDGFAELPLVIHTDSQTVRYYNKLDAFLKHFLKKWQKLWEETGEVCHIITDDWVSIPSSSDVYLGDIPLQVGRSFRNTLRWTMDNCRKFGVVFYGIAHSEEEVANDFPSGTLQSFNTHCVLRQGSYHVDVRDPARYSLIAKDLNTALPRSIIRVIGR